MKFQFSFINRRKALKYISMMAGIFLAISAVFILIVNAGMFGELPEVAQLENIRNNLATEIYSADNKLIGKLYIQDRTQVSPDEIPQHLINALIATEDKRFYEHHGIDLRSLLRVAIKRFTFQDSGGGSTLSQQLAKNLFPRKDHGVLSLPVAKVKESIIAYRLENVFSKKELLTLYLNTVPFGDNVFGIEAASQLFFNKPTDSLKVQEGAVLIGMLKANYSYNPRLFPEQSMQRRNVVLSQMNKNGYLDDALFQTLKDLPLKINYQKRQNEKVSAGYFREQIRKELEIWAGNHPREDGTTYNIYTDGLKVITTLDSRLQGYAEESVTSHMKELQKVFDMHWSQSKPWDENPAILYDALNKNKLFRELEKDGKSRNKILTILDEPHRTQLFSYQGPIEKDISTIDSIKYYLTMLQTGVLAMDPQNGDIKAWVGGIDFDYFQYDHTRESTKRQVGSTFKPFIYANALEQGMDPCKFYSGSRTTYTNFASWTPDNADSIENKFKYSFRGALALSVNNATIKVLEEAGIKETIEVAQKMGINSDLPEVPSLALGTPSISLIEMTKAYSVFANNGRPIAPRMIKKIIDRNGNVLMESQPSRQEKVISESTSRMISAMLQEVIDKGTASQLRSKYNVKNSLAGKTGTTQSNADGWFIGYNPKLVIGVWVGADDPRVRFRSTKLGSGANTAMPIFAGIFQKINKDPDLTKKYNGRFDDLPAALAEKMDCENWKEDRTFLQELLGIEKADKVKEKDFGEKGKGFFEKLGSLFSRKNKKKN